jgi:hypothetical protein
MMLWRNFTIRLPLPANIVQALLSVIAVPYIVLFTFIAKVLVNRYTWKQMKGGQVCVVYDGSDWRSKVKRTCLSCCRDVEQHEWPKRRLFVVFVVPFILQAHFAYLRSQIVAGRLTWYADVPFQQLDRTLPKVSCEYL